MEFNNFVICNKCFIYGPSSVSLSVEPFVFRLCTNAFLNIESISFNKKFFLFFTPKASSVGYPSVRQEAKNSTWIHGMEWQKSLEIHQIILFRDLLSVFYCQASFPIILEMPRSGVCSPPCPKLTLTEILPWGEFITSGMRLLLSVQTHPPSFPLILCNVNKSSVGLGGYWKARNAAHVV